MSQEIKRIHESKLIQLKVQIEKITTGVRKYMFLSRRTTWHEIINYIESHYCLPNYSVIHCFRMSVE